MKSLLVFITITTPLATAALNSRCSGPEATGVWAKSGICLLPRVCNAYNGTSKPNACPDDRGGAQCCVIGVGASAATNPCEGLSMCDWTANGCEGVRVVGGFVSISLSCLSPYVSVCVCMLGAVTDLPVLPKGRCPGNLDFACCRLAE